MSEAFSVHGGALAAAASRFGGAPRDWLDLSTGINPVPAPLPPIPPERWQRLPEQAEEDRVREAVRRFTGAPSGCPVVLAPGTQSLVSLWPHLFAPAIAAVVSPTYGEHERALRAAGHDVRRIAAPEELPTDCSLLVVVNPNNPDGRFISSADLFRIAQDLAARGGLLAVDEAFGDHDPSEGLAGAGGMEGLLVLRSFGKFFGLAGLRLGYALAAPPLAAQLAERLGPWAVSGPALAVGEALLGDPGMAEQVRGELDRQRGRLAHALDRAGLAVEGQTALFALVRDGRAPLLFEALARRRILVRPFSYRPDWLRFGNPAGAQEAERLADALHEALREIGR